MRLQSPSCPRTGLSLLEVLVALAIFLFSLVAIGQLLTMGGDRSMTVQQTARATQLCQSKLEEVTAGAVSLTAQSDTPFDDDPEWRWSLEAEQGAVPGLWSVTVRVNRQFGNGNQFEASLSKMVLDPTLRGNAGSSASNTPSTSSTITPSSTPSSNSGSPTPASSNSGQKMTTGGSPASSLGGKP